jgi:hypothetical protein
MKASILWEPAVNLRDQFATPAVATVPPEPQIRSTAMQAILISIAVHVLAAATVVSLVTIAVNRLAERFAAPTTVVVP